MKDLILRKGRLQIENHMDMTFPLTIHESPVSSSYSMSPHYHDNFEIIYVNKGKINIRIGNEVYLTKEKDILFVNMFQVHSAESADGSDGEFYAIVFDKKIIDNINMNNYYLKYIRPFLEGEQRFPTKLSTNSALYNRITDSLDLIIEEFINKDIAYEIYITTEIEKLFATLVRYNSYIRSKNNNHISTSSKNFIDGMWEYIKSNYQQKITLDEVSNTLSINKHYFCRLVKKLTGKSFTQLLNIHRVNHAIKLIKETDMSINEISELCGFSNQSYFNRIYVEYTGEIPSQTRRATKNFN